MALDYQNIISDTFSSFTGADIQAVITYRLPGDTSNQFKQKLIGTLSAITVSVVREVNPLWSMGSSDFRAVARGKRSVSGTLTFTVFDRDPLVRDLFDVSDFQQMNREYATAAASTNVEANNLLAGPDGALAGAGYNRAIQAASALRGIVAKQVRRYADQLPPFDVTISMTNEVGASSVAAVRNIYIVSQGSGWSTHDLESDQVYSYIARYYEPLTSIADRSSNFAPNQGMELGTLGRLGG